MASISRGKVPVLVLPGWGAGDASTIALRSQLSLLGHRVHPWQLGRNGGPSPELLAELDERFRQIHQQHERPIALVGWSLGGVYAWRLAQRFASQVQLVVTLGSPLGQLADVTTPASVPLSSIWSRRDGLVNWQSSVVAERHGRENIEVQATHLTLGFDPFVLAAIADRLAQQPSSWKPFRPAPWLRGFARPPRVVRKS